MGKQLLKGWMGHRAVPDSGQQKNTFVITKSYSRPLKAKHNYMFRPLTGHHQVVRTMKRVEGCTI
jgi:hypothetical protein